MNRLLGFWHWTTVQQRWSLRIDMHVVSFSSVARNCFLVWESCFCHIWLDDQNSVTKRAENLNLRTLLSDNENRRELVILANRRGVLNERYLWTSLYNAIQWDEKCNECKRRGFSDRRDTREISEESWELRWRIIWIWSGLPERTPSLSEWENAEHVRKWDRVPWSQSHWRVLWDSVEATDFRNL